MPWFKIDDGFWSHPKVLELTDEAIALWVRAGSYCAGHLTDGEVKRSTLRVLAADHNAATELVLAGLWDHDNGTWRFHDWDDYQPSREQIMTERAAAAERQRKSRDKSRRDSGGSDGVSDSAPSRPVPTRPGDTTKVSQSSHVSKRESESETNEQLFRSVLEGNGISPERLMAHIKQRTGRDVPVSVAMKVATDILGRGGDTVSKPQAYVLGSITKSWAEVQQYIDTECST